MPPEMSDKNYSNREIDSKMDSLHEKLDLILSQTTRHNGRLTRLERVMIVMGSVVTTLLIVNGSSFVTFVTALIK